MKKIVPIILCVIVWIGGCATTPSNTTPSELNEARYTLHYNQGLNRLSNNEPSYAMEEFLSAEKYKKTAELYFSMGQACYMLKRNELALDYFDKSLLQDRNFSSSNVGKGIVLRDMGKYDDALAQFKASLNNILFHEPEKAYYNMALTYLAMKDREKAVTDFRCAVSLRPEFLPPYFQLALVYGDLKNYEAAIEVLKTLLTYAPDSPEAHLLLGKMYLKLARSAAADLEFKEVIRLAPESASGREASIYLTGGNN
jgi:tetratricopeptide (TPR) repeat protein